MVFQIHAETTSTTLSSQMKLSRWQNTFTLSKKGMKLKRDSVVFHCEGKKKTKLRQQRRKNLLF